MKMKEFLISKGLYEEFVLLQKESNLDYQKEYNKNRKKPTKEKIIKIIEMKNKGLSQSQIAKELGCTRQNISHTIKLYEKRIKNK